MPNFFFPVSGSRGAVTERSSVLCAVVLRLSAPLSSWYATLAGLGGGRGRGRREGSCVAVATHTVPLDIANVGSALPVLGLACLPQIP